MTTLSIGLADIPDLSGKAVLLTGGSSGIGLAAARIFAHKGAYVTVLDLVPIDEQFDIYEIPGRKHTAPILEGEPSGSIAFRQCDVTRWSELREAFQTLGHIDIAVANAGVNQAFDHFEDVLDADGNLAEPDHRVIDVNFRSVVNFIKLALHHFRRQGPGGSIVLTSSSLAYKPLRDLSVYGATKAALLGLIRSLRNAAQRDGYTINGVAPSATLSKLCTREVVETFLGKNAPVSSAYHTGLAVVYSAVARQHRGVEAAGYDDLLSSDLGRWNGRVIFTVGETYIEVEEVRAKLQREWLGETIWNT